MVDDKHLERNEHAIYTGGKWKLVRIDELDNSGMMCDGEAMSTSTLVLPKLFLLSMTAFFLIIGGSMQRFSAEV
jgi:hypothetical protein